MTRTLPEFEALVRRLGRDLELDYAGTAGRYDDADLARTDGRRRGNPDRDIAVVDGVGAARQMLANRVLARKGELAPLGHPEYGSRHHELVGEPNTDRTRNLIKLYVLEALRHEPRVAKVLRCDVTTLDRSRDVVRIRLDLRLVDAPNELNLVVPFELAGPT